MRSHVITQMLDTLYIQKRFGTYADTFLMLGLAKLARFYMDEIGQKELEIKLKDTGTYYEIKFEESVNIETHKNIIYSDLFPPVQGKKTKIDTDKIPNDKLFNTVEHTEKRKIYRNWYLQTRGKGTLTEDKPEPPDARTQNGVIFTSMRHEKNHNIDLWWAIYQLKEHYGALVYSLLQAFSKNNYKKPNEDIETATELFKKQTGVKLPAQVSAVKIYLPTAIQGVNRTKADTNKNDSQKTDWLLLWLIAGGLFEFGIVERVKISDRVFDWQVLALEPKDINFSDYKEVLDTFRSLHSPSSSYGTARFDAELVIRFCLELLKYYETKNRKSKFKLQQLNRFVRGFSGTRFGQKGQVYGLKEIFSLGVPSWINPETESEADDFRVVLSNHLYVISSLKVDAGHGEMLAAYRRFISTSDLEAFFQFQVSYAEYITRSLGNSQNQQPRLFSRQGLDLMVKNLPTQKDKKDGKSPSLTYLVKDDSFLRIAKAINQATVYAGRDLDWSRTYGLAQRLSSQASSKNDFISELMAFLAVYEDENLRLSERLQKEGKVLKRVQPKKQDLDRLIELIEEFNNTTLIANLLIAYGYANWAVTKDSSSNDDAETQINNESDNNKSDNDESDNDESNNDDTGVDEDEE